MSRSAIIAGTGFEGRARIIKDHCYENMEVFFERQPDNLHDQNAIAVYIMAPAFLGLFGNSKKQIGFIKSNTAKHLSKKLDEGKKINAKIRSMWAPEEREHPRVTLELDI